MEQPPPYITRPRRPARRTQEERSAETRTRLLDATVESLIEVGYAGTTTTGVCDRAGLSRGAQVHHFPKKSDLVIQAVAHLAWKQASQMRERAEKLPPDNRTARLIDMIVELFAQPLFEAAIELWVAARTDRELLDSLLEFERGAGRHLSATWHEFAPDDSSAPNFDAVMELTMHMARGMALQRILRSDESRRLELIELWKNMVRHTLNAGTA